MRQENRLYGILEFIRSIAWYILLAFLFVAFFFRPMQISGTSMTPALLDGEHVMINIIHNLISEPDRFDIVVVKHADEMWVKRVIGLPNETLSYKDGKLYIDGEMIEETFLDETYMKETCERLSIDEFISADYVGNDLPLVSGGASKKWLGITWILHNNLPVTEEKRDCFIYHSTSLGHACGQEVKTDISWHGERAAHFISNSMSQGAVLIDNDGIVRLKCSDSDETV